MAVILSEAKDLLFSWAGKSRFFGPTKSVGPQNDTIGGHMAVYSNCENGLERFSSRYKAGTGSLSPRQARMPALPGRYTATGKPP